MLSAKALSEAIRMKRKKLREGGEVVDTAPKPQMNPQNIWDLEKRSQIQETIPGASELEEPGSPVMQEPQADDSQDVSNLKKHMSRIAKILGQLSMSR